MLMRLYCFVKQRINGLTDNNSCGLVLRKQNNSIIRKDFK